MKEKGSKPKKRSHSAVAEDEIIEKKPDILSPELREELGLQDADDIVMVGKKPKKEKVERASDEVLAKAKKMTKTVAGTHRVHTGDFHSSMSSNKRTLIHNKITRYTSI